MVYKLIPKEYVNYLFKAYFFLAGAVVLAVKMAEILELWSPQPVLSVLDSERFSFKLTLPRIFGTQDGSPEPEASSNSNSSSTPPSKEPAPQVPITLNVNLRTIVGLVLAVFVGAWYLNTNHWLASNLFGIAFCLQGIEMMSIGSYFNGCVLLSGLFIYDIFWVFGTDVMVTVAKNFDAPIKLLFPAGEGRPSMLGLGDIVIPGIFIALLLRFDFKRAGESAGLGFKATYFWFNLFFYVVGMCTTLYVMYTWNAAQPALLYLVPACLGSSAVLALARGEFQLLWNYVEGAEAEKSVKKD